MIPSIHFGGLTVVGSQYAAPGNRLDQTLHKLASADRANRHSAINQLEADFPNNLDEPSLARILTDVKHAIQEEKDIVLSHRLIFYLIRLFPHINEDLRPQEIFLFILRQLEIRSLDNHDPFDDIMRLLNTNIPFLFPLLLKQVNQYFGTHHQFCLTLLRAINETMQTPNLRNMDDALGVVILNSLEGLLGTDIPQYWELLGESFLLFSKRWASDKLARFFIEKIQFIDNHLLISDVRDGDGIPSFCRATFEALSRCQEDETRRQGIEKLFEMVCDYKTIQKNPRNDAIWIQENPCYSVIWILGSLAEAQPDQFPLDIAEDLSSALIEFIRAERTKAEHTNAINESWKPVVRHSMDALIRLAKVNDEETSDKIWAALQSFQMGGN